MHLLLLCSVKYVRDRSGAPLYPIQLKHRFSQSGLARRHHIEATVSLRDGSAYGKHSCPSLKPSLCRHLRSTGQSDLRTTNDQRPAPLENGSSLYDRLMQLGADTFSLNRRLYRQRRWVTLRVLSRGKRPEPHNAHLGGLVELACQRTHQGSASSAISESRVAGS